MLQSLARLAADYTYTYTVPDSSGSGSASAAMVAVLVAVWAVVMALLVVELVGVWKMFQKAGKPGWAAIIPFYNAWVLAQVAGKPGWWGLYPFLAIVPFVGWIGVVVVSIILALALARNFGKGGAFAVFGLWLFSPIGYCVLGFGSASYKGNVSGGMPTPPVAQPAAPFPPAAPTAPVQ